MKIGKKKVVMVDIALQCSVSGDERGSFMRGSVREELRVVYENQNGGFFIMVSGRRKSVYLENGVFVAHQIIRAVGVQGALNNGPHKNGTLTRTIKTVR